MARWFLLAAWVCPFTSAILLCGVLGGLLNDLIRWGPLAVTLLCFTGVVAVGTGILFLIAIAAFSLRGDVKFDGHTLILQDQSRLNRFEFPRHAVRSITIVTRKRRSFQIDPRRPLWRMFFRGPAMALDIEVPKGQIRFFKAFEKDDLRRVAEEVGAALDVPVKELQELGLGKAGVAVATGTYGKSRLGLVYLGLSVGAAILLGCSWFVVQGLRSLAWPTATGMVTQSLYEERGRGSEKKYEAVIRYEYRVNDRDYSGDELGYGTSPSDAVVKALVQSHPAGSNIEVSYDPKSPARSVVIPGVGWLLWILIGAAALPIGGVLPWLIAGPRNDLEEVVRPYKVLPERGGGSASAELMRWTAPQAVFDTLRRRALRQVLWFSIRIMIWSGLAIAGFWMIARRYTPELPAGRVSLLIGLMYSMPFLLALATVFWERRRKRSPGEYRLTSKGIVLPMKDYSLLRWERMSHVRVEVDEETGHPILVVFRKGSQPRRIPLSGDDDRDDAILAAIEQREVRRE
jgi:hypothetical protein